MTQKKTQTRLHDDGQSREKLHEKRAQKLLSPLSEESSNKTWQNLGQNLIPPPRDKPSGRLGARNLAWLGETHPSLARHLDDMAQGRFCQPIKQQGRVVNLEMGGTRLYQPNAPLQAQQEVKKYLDEKKFFLTQKTEINVLSSSRRACERQDWRLARDLKSVFVKDGRAHKARDSMPTKERSLLVVFGLGLGYHIAPLLQRLKPSNVCILETRRENMFFTACTQDFVRWSRLCARGEGHLFFIVEQDAERLEKALTHVLEKKLHFFADNFFFYRHTTMKVMSRHLEPRLQDILQSSLRNKGFFEDQIRMLDNSLRNLSTSASHVCLTPKMRVRQKEEILIIANGPSLDDSLPYLQHLCQGRVVFSCGSTLYTLLKNGIVPHYHCEIENIFPPSHHVAKIQEAGYALDNITLFASVTVQPNVVSSFPKRVFFIRPGVPFTYTTDVDCLTLVAPTVSNTALACAHAMGFSTFYLLGVDCGYKQGLRHHAKDAVHFLDKNFKKLEDARQQSSNLVFRGNFGGYVRSQEVLLCTKQELERKARAHTLSRFYNCSNGAFLEGFVPLLPYLIEPLKATAPHDTDQWHNICPRLSLADRGILYRLAQAQQLLTPCTQRLESLFAALEQAESIVDLQILHNGLSDFFNKTETDLSQQDRKSRELILSCYIGTVFIFFNKIYQCFLCASPRRWRRLRKGINGHVQQRLQDMKIRLEQLLDEAHDTVSAALHQEASQEGKDQG